MFRRSAHGLILALLLGAASAAAEGADATTGGAGDGRATASPGRGDPAAGESAAKTEPGRAEGAAGSKPPPAARPPGKAKPEELAKLRRACYGGRGKPMAEFVIDHHLARAIRGMRARDAVLSRNAYRQVLRGGADELGLLPPYIKALEATGEPSDQTAAKACATLVEKVP